jgi:glycerol-3-phosphate dehydrogenase subunit B
MHDAIVIGAGLAGLTAALRLAEEGRRVLLVAKGVGSTHLAPATIDVLGVDGDSPADALPKLPPEHPYARLPVEVVAESIEWLKARVPGYRGGLEENFLLPTAVGAVKPSAVVPETMAKGDLRGGGRFIFVDLGLKDFYAAYLADNLDQLPHVSARAIKLRLPRGREVDVGGLGLARRFEQPEFRNAVVRELKPWLKRDERVGFPAVLGLRHAANVWRDLEERLWRPVFEVATLPPSVPGMRLYEAMTSALRRAGGRILVGQTVIGAETSNGRIEGVVVEQAARPTTLRARSFVLASGGFASGGLQLDSYGRIREAVFDLPVSRPPDRPRFLPTYLDEQPLDRVGVAVDERFRPIDANGRPRFENLYAAGATLAGSAPWREGSGNGISVATGYAAATILEGCE